MKDEGNGKKSVRTSSVARCPSDEVRGDYDGFLSLAGDVSGYQCHAQRLSGPETEDEVVG